MAKKSKTKQKQETQPPLPPLAAAPVPPPALPPAPLPVPSIPPPTSPAASHARLTLASTSPVPLPSEPSSPAPASDGVQLHLPPPELPTKAPSFLATPRIVTIAEEDEEAEYDDGYTGSRVNSDKDERQPLPSDLLYEPPYLEDWALNVNDSPGYTHDSYDVTQDAHDTHDNWETPSDMAPPSSAPPANPQVAKSGERFGPSDEVAAAAVRLATAPTVSASAAVKGRTQAVSTGRNTPSLAGWGDSASAHRTSYAIHPPAAEAIDAGPHWKPTIGSTTWEQTAARLAQGAKIDHGGGGHSGGWPQAASGVGSTGGGGVPVKSGAWTHSKSGWGQGGGGASPVPAPMQPAASQPTGAWRSWGRPQTRPSPIPPPIPRTQRDSSRTRGSAWEQQGSHSHQATWGQDGDWEDDGDYDDEDEDEDERWDQDGARSRDDHEWGSTSAGWGNHQRGNQSDWVGWGQGNERSHKVTFADAGSEGTRNVLSPHQRSQILNSLLNQSTQNNYVVQNAAWGHAGGQQGQPQKAHKSKKDDRKREQRNSHQGGWTDDGGSDWGNARGDAGGTWGHDGGRWGASAADWNVATDGDWSQPSAPGWGDGASAKVAKNRQKDGKKKKSSGQDKQDHGWEQPARGSVADAWGQTAGGVDAVPWGPSNVQHNDAWGKTGGGGNWGDIPEDEEDEDMEGDRRVHFSPPSTSATSWGATRVASGYPMPSKTLMHAYNGTATTLTTGPPPSDMYDYPNFAFVDSKGEALSLVKNALFGKRRFAKDRIHWMFPPDKDERVVQVLEWIQKMSYNLGSYGLHKFLQCRERGALVTNAAYRAPNKPNEPAFDWLTFDALQATMDKTIQTSVAFYDPAVQVIVFVFLPSKSGNSMAIWRRKIRVPNNARLSLQPEISMALAGLRKEKDYFVHVDELPTPKPKEIRAPQAVAPPTKPKKKVRWWNPFEW